MATIPLFVLNNNSRIIKRRRILLDKLSDFEIRKNCGLDYSGVIDILELFETLQGERSTAIPLETKLITYLSYLRSGDFQWSLGTLSGTSQTSVSRIVQTLTSYLLQIAKNYINFPTTLEDITKSKLEFASLCKRKGFPNVLGVVDGTHIAVTPKAADEDRYVNRKHYHSINCQVVCNSQEKFLDIVARWPGSTHDSLIWKESGVRQRLIGGNLGEGWFLGDSGYPLQPKLLIPFLEPQTENQRRYNKSLVVTRCAVERTIGVWKSRFRAFCRTGGQSCYPVGKVCQLVVASCVLHNIFRDKNIPLLPEDEDFLENVVIPAEREFTADPIQRPLHTGVDIRNNLVDTYFT